MDEKQNEILRFKKLAQVLNVILTIVVWLLVGGLVFIVVATTTINSVSISDIMTIFSMQPLEFNYAYGNLAFDLNPLAISGENFMLITNSIALSTGLIILIILYFIRQIRKILKDVIDQTPFSTTTVSAMFRLGIGVMVASFLYSGSITLVDALIFNSFEIAKQLPSHISASFEINMFDGTTIIIGAILILVSGIFKYGMSLQEEVDATL